jgi:CMP-N,N'-diacetyllegionaminic acid synthase
MTKKVLSIIPARGGSKGLPRKNIIDLSGRPLIAWTIEASLKSQYITKTIVSSDDKEILDISFKYGAETIKRPSSLASDTTSSESVVKHTIDYLKSIGETFDIVILLQPTSPLRTHKHIDQAFDVFQNKKAESVISVVGVDNKILKSFTKGVDGCLNGISNNNYPFMRRQDLPDTYASNGAIYIVNVKCFLNSKSFFTAKTLGYEMPVKDSVDIDNMDDIILANCLINDN